MTLDLTLTVQCQFTPDVWTDITPWLLDDGNPPSYTPRGRPDRFAATQPSVLSLRLDNTDGRFTPELATSPYWPNVTFGRPIRAFYDVPGAPPTRYYRWAGEVNEWPTDWASDVHAIAAITATDRFKAFGRARELSSVLTEEVLYDGPTAYWPLGEPAGSTSAGDITGQGVPSLLVAGSGGELTFGSGIGPPTDGLPAVMTVPVQPFIGKYLHADNLNLPVVGGECSIECWLLVAASGGGSEVGAMSAVFADRISSLRIVEDSGGLLSAGIQVGTAPNDAFARVTTPTTHLNDGLHHVVAVGEITATRVDVSLYLDGVLADSTFGTGSGVPVPTSIAEVGVGANYTGSWSTMFAGTLAHATVYGHALTAEQALAHYTAGATGFAGETTDERIERIARYAGLVDPAQLALDVAASQVAAQTFDGGKPLDLMQEATAAEDGTLFMAGVDELTLHARTRRLISTSAFALPASQLATNLAFIEDDQSFVNDATYTRPGGNPQRVINTASADPDADGIYGDKQTYALMTDNEVLDRANWRVGTSSVHRSRCPTVKVDLRGLPDALLHALLSAEVSTRFTIDQLPANAPAASVELVVEGLGEVLSGHAPSITFATSRAPTNRVFILNLSLLDGPDVLAY